MGHHGHEQAAQSTPVSKGHVRTKESLCLKCKLRFLHKMAHDQHRNRPVQQVKSAIPD